HLLHQHEAGFVVIGARVLLAVEIAALPAPIGPGAGEAVEHFLDALFGAVAPARRNLGECRLVGHAPPQPVGHALLDDGRELGRNAGFAEVFLRQDIARDLAPLGGDFAIGEMEDARAIGIPDLAGGEPEGDVLVRIFPRDGETTLDTHAKPPQTGATLALLAPSPSTKSGANRQRRIKMLIQVGIPRNKILVTFLGEPQNLVDELGISRCGAQPKKIGGTKPWPTAVTSPPQRAGS